MRSRRRLVCLGRDKAHGSSRLVGFLNRARPARDSRKGQSPEAAARGAGPTSADVGSNRGRNGEWVHRGGNGAITLGEGNAPESETQERCRDETSPARQRGEKTAVGVAKPQGRNPVSRQRSPIMASAPPNVLKGSKAPERSRVSSTPD